MKKIEMKVRAYVVVTKDSREPLMFGDGDIDSYATFFSKADAEIFRNEQGENAIILPCFISYETLMF